MNLPLTELIVCPACRGPLHLVPGGLHCPADDAVYPVHPSGAPDLRVAGSRDRADAFASEYRAARLAEGWRPLAPELARALPLVDPPGFPPLYWPLRRESWARTAQLLDQLGAPPLVIADAGAGLPWLSHRLAELGHTVIALDLSAAPDFGLGAAGLFPTAAGIVSPGESAPPALGPGRFLPVLGDLAQPPLANGAFAAVICNASLHYADDLPAAVARLASALRPGGGLFVVDSPTAAQGRPGRGPGSRVLGRGEVAAAMLAAGLKPGWYAVRRGPLWWRRQLKTRFLGRPAFDFPIVVGRR